MLRVLLLLLFSISVAYADDGNKAAAVKDALQKNYAQFFGEVTQVNPSPIPGLYEVVTEDHIYYTDESTQYLIDGAIFDMKARRNLTATRAQQLFAVDFSKLPLDLAVKRVKGNGKRKLAYFADPNCTFCKKLEHELLNVNDVTLYLFLYPIFPGSEEKVRDIWCNKNPAQAWENLMVKGVQPPVAKCAAPTSKVLELGHKLRVNGTPALVFANGEMVPGYMPADALNKALDGNK